jgi:hypothetical protein
MIYQKNNEYYIKQEDKFFLADVTIKPHTIVIIPSSEYVKELEDAKEITYQELKRRLKDNTDTVESEEE